GSRYSPDADLTRPCDGSHSARGVAWTPGRGWRGRGRNVFSPPAPRPRYRGGVAGSRTITVTVPVVLDRDEDGVWCAHAQLRPGVGAHGEGDTEEAALADLREALAGLIEEFGVPRELSVTVAA